MILSRHSRRCCTLGAMLSFLVPAAAGQTRQYLDAPVVKSQIVVRWNPGSKTVQYAADDDKIFRNIGPDTLFLAKRGIFVTYPHLNPLSIQASASAIAVADPGYAAITKLIEAITSVATTVAPTVSNQALVLPAGAPCTDPNADIGGLVDTLYGPGTQPASITSEIKVWINAIDDAYSAKQTGAQAVSAGIIKIDKTAENIRQLVDRAKKQLETIQNCKAAGGNYAATYAASLAGDPMQRIQQLADLVTTMTKLADQLRSQYSDPTKWMDDTFYPISEEIDATFDKMQNVTVKVVKITFTVSSSSVTTDQSAAGSAAFSVRRYAALTPEIGIGAVFGTVTQPVYGTAQNAAGQTIVAKKPDKSVSVSPTVLVNFVCRCGTGLLTPMAQVGAAASKDVPAILLGGGIRLFGLSKGDVAVGGGAMFGWVKDLQKLKVGDVVTGTNDINSDLSFNGKPRIGGYFAIQYKF